ncbi:rod shape-determining protein MreC [Adlercreutzia sp. ZJ141]|uniref:rod shape-determining protein MreC n=1 Tax=Adlercreutzia sp. ZJ141 TaxID=2709406 RepID=UPI0013EDA8AD|nr:rod shape-determining protein MreC [Adlercreutzia sp. ZJ141]
MALNFQQKNSALVRRVLVIALLVIALVLITLYAREGEDGFLHSAQSSASDAASVVGGAGQGIGGALDALGKGVDNLTADDGTLSSLRTQNEELRAMVAQAEEYRQEALRLEELLDLKSSYSADGVGARIIGKSTQAWSQTVTINKGSADGLRTGLTVMGTTGVIGQTVSVSEHAATVRLITDPQSGVAALLQSSRAQGIVRGSLEGILYLENVDADATIEVGDVVLTSGLGGSYTSGLIVGTVVKVDSAQGDSSRRAVVSPNGEISALEEVLVVLGTSSSDDGSDGSASGGSGTNAADKGGAE